MYLKTPKMFNRPMKMVRKYKHHVLFMDKDTGIRQCFQYWDLRHEIIDGKVYEYNKKGSLIPISNEKSNYLRKESKLIIKKDNRLFELMEKYAKERGVQ